MTDSLTYNNNLLITLKNRKIIFGRSIEFNETFKSKIWIQNPLGIQLDSSFLETIDNINKHAWEIPGIWSVLIQDKTTQYFRAISSINNELPWYYSSEFPGIFSNSLNKLAVETGLVQPDNASICSYIALDWSVGGYSFIKGIKKSIGGSILKENEYGVVEIHPDLHKWLGFDNSIHDRQLLVEKFIEICREQLNYPDPTITLTAGGDSRAIVAAAKLTGRLFVTTTGISPAGNLLDVKIAALVSKMLNIKHIVVDASNNPAPILEKIYNEFALNFDSEYNPLNWIIHYKEFALEHKRITRILGYGGEFFSGFYSIDVYKRLSMKLQDFNAEMRQEVLDRIDKRIQKMQDLSEVNARDLFYQRERDQWWVSSNIRALLPYRIIHTPFRDTRLLSLGYRFKGGIRACHIHSILLMTLPKDVQKIPINGGRCYVFYSKIKKRFLPRLNYNLLASPDHMMKVIDLNFFGEIISEKKIRNMINAYARHRGGYASQLHKILGIQYFFNNLSPSKVYF